MATGSSLARPSGPSPASGGSPRATEEPDQGPGQGAKAAEVRREARGVDGAGRPVAIDVGTPQEEGLLRWVEGVLGWQVVDRQTSALVPPTVHLVGMDAEPPQDGIPRVLLLEENADPAAVVAASQRLRPSAGIVWPRQRDELGEIVRAAVSSPAATVVDRQVLSIGGVAGGVGTTTVALAVAGLAAWRGTPTFVTVRGDAPADDLPTVIGEATAAVDLWARLPPLPGVPACRAVRIADPGPAAQPRDPAIGFTVFDHGVDTDTDVVVCRRDAAAIERLPGTTAAVIVIIDTGPVGLRDLRRATDGRPAILLPWSARVARAGLHRRVPGSLPGAWLRRLLPLLPDHPDPGAGHQAPVARSGSEAGGRRSP